MKINRRCPRCRLLLETNADECYCGWVSAKSDKSFEPDHQCVFALSGRRCPLDGSTNASTHGSGIWYCSEHLRNLNNPDKSKEVLNWAEDNYESLMEDRIDWRAKLYEEEYQIRKSKIKKIYETLKSKLKGVFL